MTRIAVIVALLVAGPVSADELAVTTEDTAPPFAMWGTEGTAFFDWSQIKKCAAQVQAPVDVNAPGMNNMLSRQYREFENKFRTIQECRMMLSAHHAGWTDAAPDKEDPFPPEPMTRDGDLGFWNHKP